MGNHHSHYAGSKGIEHCKDCRSLCRQVLLSHGLEGEAEAAAEEDQEQQHAPLVMCLGQGKAFGAERYDKTYESHHSQLDYSYGNRVSFLGHFLGGDYTEAIGEGGADHQGYAQKAVV